MDDDALAAPRDVRLFGVYALVVGAVLSVLGLKGWLLRGVLPLHWLGFVVAALGLAMIANPEQPSFRERVGRLKTIGRSDR